MMIYENPDYNEDILWFDYYSDKGLIQRNVSIFNLEFTDETGSVIGTGNSFDEINLSEYFVK